MMSPSASGTDPLFRRLQSLVIRVGADVHADDVRALLASCHSSAGRCYRDLSHVGFCLSRLDEVSGELGDPAAAELALWFQDAVHDPAADDNELRSALLFDVRLGVHLPTALADAVHALIMATAHSGDPGGSDARFVADIDLSRLALPRDRFTEAVELWCRESGDRVVTVFLTSLSARPNIFFTRCFRDRWEDRARSNIERYLSTSP